MFFSLTTKLPTENLDQLFSEVIKLDSWNRLQLDFNQAKKVIVIGNGGNLAVADHGAVDITRLSHKFALCPGSGILATSIIGDSSIDVWFTNWLRAYLSSLPQDFLNSILIIGISSSGTASNIVNCLKFAHSLQLRVAMISSRLLPDLTHVFNTVCIGTDYYHTGEVLSLLLFYQLVHGSGCECPSISKKLNQPSFDRLVNS